MFFEQKILVVLVIMVINTGYFKNNITILKGRQILNSNLGFCCYYK